jgi:hypothetical protein
MLLKALLTVKTYLTFLLKINKILVIPTGYYREKKRNRKKIVGIGQTWLCGPRPCSQGLPTTMGPYHLLE